MMKSLQLNLYKLNVTVAYEYKSVDGKGCSPRDMEFSHYNMQLVIASRNGQDAVNEAKEHLAAAAMESAQKDCYSRNNQGYWGYREVVSAEMTHFSLEALVGIHNGMVLLPEDEK
jgi:hypothetical protein